MEKLLNDKSTVMEAVRSIEGSHRRIAIVLSEEGLLLGTITDGDVRRHLLRRGSLDDSVLAAMNPEPLTVGPNETNSVIVDLLRSRNVLAIPVIDKARKYLRLIHLNDIYSNKVKKSGKSKFSCAVIMAGGEGLRMRPVTENLPKPMVEVGGMPIIERQVRRLKEIGLNKIYISVNYLGNIIENHFGDGSSFGLEIAYLREREKMGTVGSLTLLPENLDGPILVLNGDLITGINYENLEEFHTEREADLTIAAIEHTMTVPFGVINHTEGKALEIVEKPTERFTCNAGIYVLSGNLIPKLGSEQIYIMTDFINYCISEGLKIGIFPIFEYWQDVGTQKDLEVARTRFVQSELLT